MYINLNQLKRLTNLKASIHHQNRNQKLLYDDVHHELEQIYKPVIDPLKEIVNKPVIVPALAIEPAPAIPAVESSPAIPAIEPPLPPTYQTLSLGILADRYLKTPVIQYDHAYGIKPIEGSVNFRLGRMDVKVDGDDFTIDEKKYKGTEGLWKLLTLKNPGNTSPEDLETYKEMLLQTKAFLLEGQDRVKCNRGQKYKTIIKPIADEWRAETPYSTPCASPAVMKRRRLQSVQGTGTVFLPSDPNELVARHKLLFGSFQTGNTGVFNELQAINDRLLQLDIFDYEMIQRLNKWKQLI
jgi:hypothetical protein